MTNMLKAFAAAGFGLACGIAQAGNISWSIGIHLPIANAPIYADGPYHGGAPVYHAPPPVVYRPAPIYHAPPPVAYRPAPIYYVPPPVVYAPVPRYERPPHHHHRHHRDWHRDQRRWERTEHGRYWRDRD